MIDNLLRIPYVFVLLNWAAVVALWYWLRGRDDVWSPAGEIGSDPPR